MTEQLSPVAVQNGPLLRAIKEGAAGNYVELAEMAGIAPNHVHRKLNSLEAEGLIVREEGAPVHVAALTEAAEKALLAIDVYEGRIAAGGEGASDVSFIPLAQIIRWAKNPRRHFSDVTVMEMAQSVADKGVLQPLVVRPAAGRDGVFELVIGERRWRGAGLAVQEGWVPADFKVPCRIRAYSDAEALEVAGVENLQREDLHWMDEAQFYLNLMQAGRSAAEIERIVGGTRGKRSIQDYAKIARELSAEDVARTYLDEKHASYLPYVRARDLVGEKKERPALELTPKLRLTLLELIAAGDGIVGPGQTIVTKMHKPPVGGPLDTLSTQRKLIAFGFEAREVVCRIKVTDDLAKYLQQIGWYADADADACLRKAREDVIGEMQAAALEPGEYVTPELNAPKAPAAAPRSPEPEPAPAPTPAAIGERPDDAHPGEPIGGFLAEEPEDEPLTSTEAPPAVQPTPAPTAEPETPSLPPMLQIVLIELAHRIAARGHERTPGAWAVEILANYYKDQRGMQLVQQHRMIKFVAAGTKTVAMINDSGLAWLEQNAGVWQAQAGRPSMTDDDLLALQRELGFKAEAGQYATAWLNDPEPEPRVEAPEAEPAPEPQRPAGPPAGHDSFARQVLAATAEERALGRAAAALREARIAISAAKSAKLPPDRVAKLHQLIDDALDAAAPFLGEQPPQA